MNNAGHTFGSKIGIPIRLAGFGCYALVMDGEYGVDLFTTPIERGNDSLPDGDWIEVIEPQSQDFLDAVNDFYGTHFYMEDF